MKHAKTIEFYNTQAAKLQHYYKAFGAREGDIALAFALIQNKENARVLELGCGNGRDAREITRRTPLYVGIDFSEEMIKYAKEHVDAEFMVGDYTAMELPKGNDVVFAFATLRHLDQEEMTTLLHAVYEALVPGGVFYASLNYGDMYKEEMRDDEFGVRIQHLYNPRLICKLAGPSFTSVHEAHDTVRGVEWFDIALRKK